MRTAQVAVIALLLAGCAVIPGVGPVYDYANKQEEVRSRQAQEQEQERRRWEDASQWEESQLDDLQRELRFHWSKDITCFLNAVYDGYTPQSFVTEVRQGNERLGRKWKGYGPSVTADIAADVAAIARVAGEPLSAIRRQCRVERCEKVAESQRNRQPGSVVLVDEDCGPR
ncbi:hypothetical protein [Anaeromyxobacter soli]|uniref:hypothetical protein n=1 Tax=Anaeromyxobacter soli TaxID=2922725 RepID=UPI001FB0167E|nr:hypothetical protein [Anaeromyxobacter sp. SG29]